jgi:hypothetical protein
MGPPADVFWAVDAVVDSFADASFWNQATEPSSVAAAAQGCV